MMRRSATVLLLLLSFNPALGDTRKGYPVFGLIRRFAHHMMWPGGQATGFSLRWGTKRYLITNWHVCRHGGEFSVHNEQSNTLTASTVIAEDPSDDLCVMTSVQDDGVEVGTNLKNGYPVYTGGYPAGHDNRLILRSGRTTRRSDVRLRFEFDQWDEEQECLSGFVLSKDGRACVRSFVVQDTTLLGTFGCSGSPVLNSAGKLVGVINSKRGDEISYIPVDKLIELLQSLDTQRP